MTVSVEVFSDVICPWCFIGKRRLEKAVAALDGSHTICVQWFPFQLNPHLPKAGISRRDYRIKKFGSWERSMELDANIVAIGKEEGIEFQFDRIERTPNTADAHRLIWLADQRGVQDAVVEALFRAYFTAGQDIGNRDTLMEVVATAGLDREAAAGFLDSDAGRDEVKTANVKARHLGVAAVPYFIVNQKIQMSGAQEPDSFLTAFRQAMTSE